MRTVASKEHRSSAIFREGKKYSVCSTQYSVQYEVAFGSKYILLLYSSEKEKKERNNKEHRSSAYLSTDGGRRRRKEVVFDVCSRFCSSTRTTSVFCKSGKKY
jgi:hypothetical protein